jgi:hypothetical protein
MKVWIKLAALSLSVAVFSQGCATLQQWNENAIKARAERLRQQKLEDNQGQTIARGSSLVARAGKSAMEKMGYTATVSNNGRGPDNTGRKVLGIKKMQKGYDSATAKPHGEVPYAFTEEVIEMTVNGRWNGELTGGIPGHSLYRAKVLRQDVDANGGFYNRQYLNNSPLAQAFMRKVEPQIASMLQDDNKGLEITRPLLDVQNAIQAWLGRRDAANVNILSESTGEGADEAGVRFSVKEKVAEGDIHRSKLFAANDQRNFAYQNQILEIRINKKWNAKYEGEVPGRSIIKLDGYRVDIDDAGQEYNQRELWQSERTALFNSIKQATGK